MYGICPVALLGLPTSNTERNLGLWGYSAVIFLTKTQKYDFSTTRWGRGGIHVHHPEKEAQTILAYVSFNLNLIPQFIRTRTYYESIYENSTLVVKRNKLHNITVDRKPTITSADAILSPRVLLDPQRDPADDLTTLAPSTTPPLLLLLLLLLLASRCCCSAAAAVVVYTRLLCHVTCCRCRLALLRY